VQAYATPNNFLILDEPTNHLDIKSKEVLKQALQNFDGTFIVVSHDREFLQGLTNKTYEFTNNGIKEFLGTIDEFLEKKKVDGFRQFEQDKQAVSGHSQVASSQKSVANSQKQEPAIKVDNKVKEIEKKIEKLEAEIKKWEVKMATEEFLEKSANDNSAYDAYNKLKADLDVAMSEWEAIA
jgi:ATP-binding cassette subfamily F protein 3